MFGFESNFQDTNSANDILLQKLGTDCIIQALCEFLAMQFKHYVAH